MSDRFAPAALRWAALAAGRLGWTPGIFWTATPSELRACLPVADCAATPPTPAEIAALVERDAQITVPGVRTRP